MPENTNAATNTDTNTNTKNTNTAPFYSSFQNSELKGYAELKNFKDPEAVVNSYRELEKFHGVSPDRLLKLPEKMDDDKAFLEIANKLGRPEKAEGYELEVPQGMDKKFSEWARTQFHTLGLTKKQGEALTKNWNARVKADADAATTSAKDTAQQQMTKLKEEWGAAYAQNTQLVDKFVEKLGIKDTDIDGLDRALGIDGTNRFLLGVMNKFGIGAAQLDEPGFRGVGNESGGGNNFGNILSPDAALARIEELKSDTEWRAKFSAGGKAEKDEWNRLHRWAVGMK